MTKKIDWDKIKKAHPYFRDVIAGEQGVKVATVKKRLKVKDRTINIFEENSAT